jgi:quercetin 2,3-dioxygenase
MSTIIRPAGQRGHTQIGWLDSWHSFSFSNYYDPEWMGWRGLRVINDDIIAPAMGFGEHGHRDMAILTWMLSGTLAHRDSLGNGDQLVPGDVQVMQAGRGIRHSEMNPSKDEAAHLLQIWIEPVASGLPPAYNQRHISKADRAGRWAVLADRDGSRGGLRLGADAVVSVANLTAGAGIEHVIPAGRGAWLHVARGSVAVDGKGLTAGDAIAQESGTLAVSASTDAEVLCFDLG